MSMNTKNRARKISKRILRIESLENRELLSVNPMAAAIEADYVQAASTVSAEAESQTFAVEDGEEVQIGTELPYTMATGSVNHVTTNSAKLEWNKPAAKYKVNGNYTVYLSEDPLTVEALETAERYESKTNALMLTGLDLGETYYYYIEANVTSKVDGEENLAIAKGTFTTLDTVPLNSNLQVPIGMPTDVKVTYVAAKGTTPAGIKVTWKAPQNATAGYILRFDTSRGLDERDLWPESVDLDVGAGEKTEVFVAITADGAQGTLKANEWFNVSLCTDSNTILNTQEATPTRVYTAATMPGDLLPELEGVTVTTAVASPKKAAASVTVDSTHTVYTVHWKAAATDDLSGYLIVLKDANKAVLAYDIADYESFSYDFGLNTGFNDILLTPKTKYTIEIYTMSGNAMASKPLSIAFTTADFSPPTIKVVGKPGLAEATIDLVPAKSAPGDAVFYVIQTTSAADSKGNPDWDAGSYIFLDPDDLIFLYPDDQIDGRYRYTDEALKGITLEGLQAGTQYFVRAVIIHDNGNVDWEMSPYVSVGKTTKFKTAAVPSATIGKIAFDMNYNYEMGLNFTFKSPDLNDKAGILSPDDHEPTFEYEIWVAPDTAKVGADGKLIGAKRVMENVPFVGVYDAKDKVVEYHLEDGEALTFKDIANTIGDIREMKGIQIQVLVKYVSNGQYETDYYATTYTKPAKLTLPKWFV